MLENEFFRQVNSIDTEAGERLRYMFTRARCCYKYAIDINYFEVIAKSEHAYDILSSAFLWYKTPEGSEHWKKLYQALG